MAIHKVLIVDDSKTEIMFLTELLQKNGFVVRSAENADEAFKRLTEEKPDLILMDVVMPGQNGFQLTRAINRTPEYAHAGDRIFGGYKSMECEIQLLAIVSR